MGILHRTTESSKSFVNLFRDGNFKLFLTLHDTDDVAFSKQQEFEVRTGDEMMSLDLAEVSQCVLPGNNRNEVELQFPESDAIEANNDQLVSIRFYIPPDPEVDPADRTVKSSAELLQQRIMQMANIRKTTGDVIGTFQKPFAISKLLHCLNASKYSRERFFVIVSHSFVRTFIQFYSVFLNRLQSNLI